jgi:hypothetical protein
MRQIILRNPVPKIGRKQKRLIAHSDENGHLFRRKAATHSNPKRPLFQWSELTGVIDAVG